MVIVFAAQGDMGLAVEAMKLGAKDFVSKPWENEKVIATLSAAVQLRQTRSEAKSIKASNKVLAQASTTSSQLVMGQSAAMKEVMVRVERAAPTDANVLILGENGTGKELIARALHQASNRADHVFMTVDLGAVSETLFESELFGHEKGAFTGAIASRVGRFELADGGTLFLDEIGDMPLSMQVKLLRVLQEHSFERVGGVHTLQSDVRILAATHRDLEEMIALGEFRQDLYYRLNVFPIEMPSLRERPEDIPLLLNELITIMESENRGSVRFNSVAINALCNYEWPGNVRELQNLVERHIALADGPTLKLQNLDSLKVNKEDASGIDSDWPPLSELERRYILKVLDHTDSNREKAAQTLAINKSTLWRKLQQYKDEETID